MNIDKFNRLIELSKAVVPLAEPNEAMAKLNGEFFQLCYELLPQIFKGCQNEAEWAIDREDDIYSTSYSCTDCLSKMIDAETTSIKRIEAGEWGECNLVYTIPDFGDNRNAPQG